MTDALSLIDEWGPEKVVVVSDRRSGMRGVLVIDNTARGAAKGGTRMSPSLSVGEVARLARTMTWKWAAVDLFHGGAKAGILGDPRGRDKERVLRAFARALAKEVPSDYVFGLDLGLSENDAAVLVDELGDRGVATGLPRSLGGLPYDELGVTGFGVAEVADEACTQLGSALAGSRVAIQGFGAVGRATARRLHELGAVIVAVSTASGWTHDPDGLNVDELVLSAAHHGDDVVRAAPGFSPHAQELLEAKVDVLVPAAREDTIDVDAARSTTARLVVEGANLPTSQAARDVLHARGIPVVPDFIANAGGIVAAAHSTDARHSPFVVEPSGVFTMISARLRDNTRSTLQDALQRGVPPRRAALDLAQSRVLAAMAARRCLPGDGTAPVGAALHGSALHQSATSARCP